MELLAHRYRNLTVLVVVLLVQLLLRGYQVKSDQDVRLIRVWAVTAVTPLARVLEQVRSRVAAGLEDYVLLTGVRQQNRRLRRELGKLKLKNQYLEGELAAAKRAIPLGVYQQQSPSKTVAARIIGAGTAPGSRVVFIDRGSASGILRGMAVITPDGIVGRVSASYPTASQVVLVTDTGFAAAVISQNHHVEGTLKGQGSSLCRVDYVQDEEKVDPGEWFYTSGDDRVFPRGLPVGRVRSVRDGEMFKRIELAPSGFSHGLEEVLVVLEGVHQPIPPAKQAAAPADLLPLPAPPADGAAMTPDSVGPRSTAADRVRALYQRIGEEEGHTYGTGNPGAPPPDFNRDLENPPARPTAPPAPAQPPKTQPR